MIERAAVVGAGTMGSGIAMVFADAGIPVLLKEQDRAALDRGMAMIRRNYKSLVKYGHVSVETAEERLGLITGTTVYDDFASVDIVVEAVYESVAAKHAVFLEIDAVCKPGTILATNTSSLDVDEIASCLARPEAAIGLHFFTPPHLNRLLEIVPGRKTGQEVTETCIALAGKLGKVGVVVGNCRGFVANRMFIPYHDQALLLVEDGATVEQVDGALVEFGMGIGPLTIMDLVGIDVGWQIREAARHLERPGSRQPFVEDHLYEMKRFGRKTALGWYRYAEGQEPGVDEDFSELVHEWAAERGIVQREVSQQEIVERCVYMLVNEGAKIIEEGIAASVADVDRIVIAGYGFPAARGGPMRYADSIGLAKVYERVCDFAALDGDAWKPAPLLKKLAESGGTFYA